MIAETYCLGPYQSLHPGTAGSPRKVRLIEMSSGLALSASGYARSLPPLTSLIEPATPPHTQQHYRISFSLDSTCSGALLDPGTPTGSHISSLPKPPFKREARDLYPPRPLWGVPEAVVKADGEEGLRVPCTPESISLAGCSPTGYPHHGTHLLCHSPAPQWESGTNRRRSYP